jgi:vitellogenic carboxypeptidase-like protein
MHQGGKGRIPSNELGVARDLFLALQSFYLDNKFTARPLIITGESYAGKYVPSIAHYILQQTFVANGKASRLDHPRPIPETELQPPAFTLAGIAVGNGFTDADTQTQTQADVAWSLGLIDHNQKMVAESMQLEIMEAVRNKAWKMSRTLSDALNAFIINASSTSTLEDVRRNLGYDGHDAVDAFVNQPHVKRSLNVPNITWTSCSDDVDEILGPDIMKSVKNLVIDLVNNDLISLFYAGQFDVECGAASNDAWISTMKFNKREEFYLQPRQVWRVAGRAAGFWRGFEGKGPLMQLVIRNTGHMVPHDNPLIGQLMIEKFIQVKVLGLNYTRDQEATSKMERDYANPDEGPNANPDEYYNSARMTAQRGRTEMHK